MTLERHRSIHIRVAADADFERAITIYRLAFAPLRSTYRFVSEVAAHQEKRAREGVRLLAELGGEAVGTVQYRLDPRHVHILNLAVHPDHQGRGVARGLIDHIAGLAPSLGHEWIVADTIRETGNVAFFERLGFRLIREEIAEQVESDLFDTLHIVYLERRASGS